MKLSLFNAIFLLGSLSTAFLTPPPTAADEIKFVNMPVALAAAIDRPASDNSMDYLDGGPLPLAAVRAEAKLNYASAVGSSGAWNYVMANSGTDTSSSVAFLYTHFTVQDPQQRPTVRTILKFKSAAGPVPCARGAESCKSLRPRPGL